MAKTYNCTDCIWFKTFNKQEDEVSNMGCKQGRWAGYISDTNKPICSGTAYCKKSAGNKTSE